MEPDQIQIRVFGDTGLPTLVFLPGLHGDWTLVTSFRVALTGRVRFVEVTYPRTLTWSIHDYANAIHAALLANGITCGWLLAESFGSQPAWALLEQFSPENPSPPPNQNRTHFQTEGLILAAGFVKHPFKLGPRSLRAVGKRLPMSAYSALLKIHGCYSRIRHLNAPETMANMKEFAARRTRSDREAMRHRLSLLDQYDPRPVARQTRIPVYYMNGSVDPLVPWAIVRRWLRNNCPGYRGGKMFWLADHNVLATAPAAAANQVLQWMSAPQTQ